MDRSASHGQRRRSRRHGARRILHPRRLPAGLVVGVVTVGALVLPTQVAGADSNVVVTCNGSGPGSLPAVVASAPPGSTISFASQCDQSDPIVLTNTIPIDTDLTITGPGPQEAVVSGNGAVGVFAVASGVTATVSGLTITDGRAASGAGIVNNGTLALSQSTVSANDATDGGGLYAAIGSTTTVTDVSFAGNLATSGGNIDNAGTAVVSGSSLSNGSADEGGGIFNGPGASMTLETSTLTADTASAVSASGAGRGRKPARAARVVAGKAAAETLTTAQTVTAAGGGLFNDAGTVSITDSTVSDDSSSGDGGGIANQSGTVTVADSTVSGDTAAVDGGGSWNHGGQETVSDSTVSGDSAVAGGGLYDSGALTVTNSTVAGNSAQPGRGGGIGNNSVHDPRSKVTVTAAVVAGNTAGGDCGQAITDGGYNLDDDGSCGFLAATDQSDTAADLDPAGLRDNGGPTPTIALEPASPAVGAVGSGVLCASPDQRGFARPTPCDSGAYQTTALVVTNCNDSGLGSLRRAVEYTSPGRTVTFTATCPPSSPITLAGTIVIGTNLTIAGPGAADVAVSGTALSAFSLLRVPSGVTAAISGLTIENSSIADMEAGGIDNNGVLDLSDSVLSGNETVGSGGAVSNKGTLDVSGSRFSDNWAYYGGAIFNDGGVVTVTGSTLDHNGADTWGGAVDNNSGTATITDSTLSGNGTNPDAGAGGAVYNRGTVTIADSTVSDNSAVAGGGLLNWATATVSESTFSGNTAVQGAAIANDDGTAAIAHSTLAGNLATADTFSPPEGAGIFDNSGATVNAAASIVADSSAGGDCSGAVTTLGDNLDDDGSCGFTASSDHTDTAVGLDPAGLLDHGGPTPTISLVAGSPAIGAVSSPSVCSAPDQRGFPRPTPCDIGAYQTNAHGLAQSISYSSTPPPGATVGGSLYTVSATATSGLPVSFRIDGSASSVCSVSGASVSFQAAGTCVIDADQGGDLTYGPAPEVPQSVSVGQGSQVISFTSTAPLHATVGGVNYVPHATASSGQKVTFSIDLSAASVCAFFNGAVGYIGAGTCTIDANQAGNADYLSAPPVTQSFAVAPEGPTITSPASTTAIVGEPFSFTVTTAGTPVPTVTESGVLPKHLSFVPDSADGTAVISGTPTKSGVVHLTVKATFGKGRAKVVLVQALTLTVDAS